MCPPFLLSTHVNNMKWVISEITLCVVLKSWNLIFSSTSSTSQFCNFRQLLPSFQFCRIIKTITFFGRNVRYGWRTKSALPSLRLFRMVISRRAFLENPQNPKYLNLNLWYDIYILSIQSTILLRFLNHMKVYFMSWHMTSLEIIFKTNVLQTPMPTKFTLRVKKINEYERRCHIDKYRE